jgi:hypothetical protein
MTIMAELTGSLGFAPRRTEKTLSKRRAAAIELIATFSLTVSLAVAATAVSLGNRSLARIDALERPSVQLPIDKLLDRADTWLSLKAED